MAFDGTEGGKISPEEAAALTAAHRRAFPRERKGHFFGKEILNQLLAQEGCVGIRMYHGLDREGQREMVLVGANAVGDDMLDLVADMSAPCPKTCPKSNLLNP